METSSIALDISAITGLQHMQEGLPRLRTSQKRHGVGPRWEVQFDWGGYALAG